MTDLAQILASGKPYFGDFLIAKQGPYEDYLPHFKNLVVRASLGKDGPLTILEVGSWAGGSLTVWDQATNGTARFVVIEQWKPYLNDPSSECHQLIDEAARNGSIEELFWYNMRVLGIEDRIILRRGDSKTVLAELAKTYYTPPSFADIAFIDGDHRYASARADIEGAMPLVREGGILCGDDLQVQVGQIIDGELGRHKFYLHENYLNAHLSDGRFYHPGVTQAVADLFLVPLPTAGRLWAVQKVEGGWLPLDF